MERLIRVLRREVHIEPFVEEHDDHDFARARLARVLFTAMPLMAARSAGTENGCGDERCVYMDGR